MIKKLLSLITWIVMFQLVGYALGEMSRHGIENWYVALNKSSINPPDIVFPVVWSILYIALAVIGWKLSMRRHELWAKLPWILFIIQIFMNWAWTPLFFQLHWITFSLCWIIMMLVLSIIIIFLTWDKSKLIAWLLIPYNLWLVFATYLTFVIWIKN